MGVNDMLRVPAKALTNYKLLYPVAATQQVSRRQEITFKRVAHQEGKSGQEGIRIHTLEGESLFGILIVNHLHEPTAVTNKSNRDFAVEHKHPQEILCGGTEDPKRSPFNGPHLVAHIFSCHFSVSTLVASMVLHSMVKASKTARKLL
ncbi:hypothetical protein V8G54_009316 [Vigna mungo]|uniref:Uncharacterized protein n=1 Tax=Vigna mungo TaxID=3915 RepID=A0AAQ3NUK7_VIGMU